MQTYDPSNIILFNDPETNFTYSFSSNGNQFASVPPQRFENCNQCHKHKMVKVTLTPNNQEVWWNHTKPVCRRAICNSYHVCSNKDSMFFSIEKFLMKFIEHSKEWSEDKANKTKAKDDKKRKEQQHVSKTQHTLPPSTRDYITLLARTLKNICVGGGAV